MKFSKKNKTNKENGYNNQTGGNFSIFTLFFYVRGTIVKFVSNEILNIERVTEHTTRENVDNNVQIRDVIFREKLQYCVSHQASGRSSYYRNLKIDNSNTGFIFPSIEKIVLLSIASTPFPKNASQLCTDVQMACRILIVTASNAINSPTTNKRATKSKGNYFRN